MPRTINVESRGRGVRWAMAVAMATLATPLCMEPAEAQVNLQLQIGLPTIRFETAPALVEVTPGVQVVEDYEQEVFFVDGWYWCRSGPTWYQTRDHRGRWVLVEHRAVPTVLVHSPPGRYKHYRGKGHHRHGHGDSDDHGKHRKMDGRGGDFRDNKDHGRKEHKQGKKEKKQHDHKQGKDKGHR